MTDSGDAKTGRDAKTLIAPARWLFLATGYAAVGLAVAGTVLPLLPTTPFLLVAAWAFTRANPRLKVWLHNHPRFGRFLRDWDRHRAIPRPAKVAAVGGMTMSWSLVAVSAEGPMTPAVVAVVLLAVGGYIVTRPVPPRQ